MEMYLKNMPQFSFLNQRFSTSFRWRHDIFYIIDVL